MADRLTIPTVGEPFREVHHHWLRFLILGIFLVIAGTAALAAPLAATLGVTLVVGWLLLIVGVAQLVHAFAVRGWRGTLTSALGGVLALLVGFLMTLNPGAGTATLTLLVTAFLLVGGLFKLISAFRVRPAFGWLWLLAGGVLSMLLGLLIVAQWPGSAAWVIGLFVGVDLIFTGWTLVMLALLARRDRRELAPGHGATGEA